jgi:hypothetical protein
MTEDDSTDLRGPLDRWFRRVKAHKWSMRHEFTEKEFEPHVKAIGQLLLAWNDLHEKLALLFVFALGGGFINRPAALWNAVRNDMGKRQLLAAVIDEIPNNEIGERTKLRSEIKWIVTKTNELEGFRDDAAHTPLGYSYPLSEGPLSSLLSMASGIFAESLMGNKRAQRVNRERMDLLAEFEWARQRIIILRDYAMAIDLAWGNEQLPWPDRPKLPNPPPRLGPQRAGGSRKKK